MSEVVGATLADVDTEWLTAPLAEPWVRLTHRPTGTTAEGRGEHAYAEALGALVQKLVTGSDITINAGRHMLGLPPWKLTGENDPLTKDEVRQLLRECVTVVKPGEALVVRIADLTPMQMQEYQRAVRDWHENGDLPFPVFIFIGDEIGVVEAAGERVAWLRDIREDVFRNESAESVRLTHLPTGVVTEGATREDARRKMAEELVRRGGISINDARAAHGLPAFGFLP